MIQGLLLVGKFEGEEPLKSYTMKDGTQIDNKVIAISTGGLQNILVEVPKTYVVEKDAKGMVSLQVNATAKTWDEQTKRFQYVQVKFYIPRA